jgi:hypothetical protein
MICSPSYLSSDSLYHTFAALKKKYKPIALKVCLVITDLPDHFRIVCNITGDPLKNNVSLAEALFNRATDQQPTAPEDDKFLQAVQRGYKQDTILSIVINKPEEHKGFTLCNGLIWQKNI